MTSSEVEDSEAMHDVASASLEGKRDSPFSDPVFQQLAHINGLINRMKIEDIIAKMKQLKLDVNGNKDVLRKRLKSYYKDQKLKQAHMTEIAKCNECPYKFLCVIDFEATCDSSNGPCYPHEIIEFPAILIDTAKCAIVDTFHEYVRPTVNPLLSDFCTALTGISQKVVDKADTFEGVLNRFLRWKEQHQDDSYRSFVVVTDGPWDMGRFLILQCKASGIPYPDFAKKWINIRKSYSNFYKTMRLPLAGMLEFLGMSFEGQPHSGLDDAKNIARVVLQMLKDGASLHINERITWNSLTHSGKQLGDTVVSVNRKGKSSRDKKKTCDKTSEKEGTNKFVSEAMELMSRIEIDPAVEGSEAVLYKQKQSSKRQLV